jgi:hypothetical protein
MPILPPHRDLGKNRLKWGVGVENQPEKPGRTPKKQILGKNGGGELAKMA